MNMEDKLKLSVIYSLLPASLGAAYGFYSLIGSYCTNLCWIAGFLSLFGLKFVDKKAMQILVFVSLVALSLGAAAIIPVLGASGGIMDAFVVLLSSILMFRGMKNTYLMLYDGLSFYLVGLFLTLAYAVIQLFIVGAGYLDYLISCLGESCPPYTIPTYFPALLFLSTVPALYPYFQRTKFRRNVHDKEGS